MRGLCILPPPAVEEESASQAFDHLCATVLQESHLCPVPLEFQPVTWEFDHSLWVYPLPNGLVLADAEPAARYTFDSCACMNPGSLLEGTFGAWIPVANEMELCDVAGGDEEEEEEEDEEQEDVMEDEQGDEVRIEEGGVEHVGVRVEVQVLEESPKKGRKGVVRYTEVDGGEGRGMDENMGLMPDELDEEIVG